jgi:serine/threonine protein phosphatase 1
VPAESVFAILPAGRRIWAVGAVFGACEALVRLHEALAERLAADDHLVYSGNLLGRGVEVLETVHELLLFRRWLMARQTSGEAGAIVYLRGSQEEMWHKLLQMQFAPNPRRVLDWMLDQGVGTTIEAYGGSIAEGEVAANGGALPLSRWTGRLRQRMQACDGHQQLMSALKRAAYTDDRRILFVNAGIDPARPIEAQNDSFWWNDGGFDRLSQPFDGFAKVVRGYDPRHRGVSDAPLTASVDGGCGFGGRLVAGCFDPAGEMVDRIEV